MTKRLLLTRSKHDVGNRYLYAYSEELLQTAESKGWKADKAENDGNNREEVASRLKKTKPNLVVFNGHGENDVVYGNKNERLVDVDCASLLAGTVVFARSCSAVNELGKKAVSEGCKAFVGYDSEFLIPYLNERVATPLSDPMAKPVLDVSNIVAKSLLNGSSVGNSVQASKRKASELLFKMISSEEPYDRATFSALFLNDLSIAFEGDSEAKACL